MDPILQKIAAFRKILVRCNFVYLLALVGILALSAFQSRSKESVVFVQELSSHPTDSLGKADLEGTKKLIKEHRVKQLTDTLISFALSLEGKPYRYGGTSPKGFDCSGFVFHVFKTFGIALNRSSRTQASQGKAVPLEQVKKGDLLFFTGTNPQNRTVGHVGIVISEIGEKVLFVHSSSNGGVKISGIEGYYESRFMEAKRILGVE